MGLKSDLQSSFEDNLDKGGEIADVAKLIVDNYKDAVEAGTDSLGNKWQGVNYKLIESAIIAQLNLSFATKSYLQFTLIEASLIAAWASATLKLPAIPAPGMSVVNTGSVTISSVVGTTPLVADSSSYDPIVTKFFSMFSKHSKTLTFLYVGIAIAGIPPPPISVPVSSFTIK